MGSIKTNSQLAPLFESTYTEVVIEPQLQAPGAGLPFVQRLFLKYYFGPFVSKRSRWIDNENRFRAGVNKILRLIEPVAPVLRQRKILIGPIGGLEDSSRFWSINETLEHLLIVNQGMAHIMINLSHGRPFPKEVKIAEVKPQGQRNPAEVLAEFKELNSSFLPRLLESVKDRDSKMTHVHPWFGPFTTHQWFWILGVHLHIHANQIKAIIEGLNHQSTH